MTEPVLSIRFGARTRAPVTQSVYRDSTVTFWVEARDKLSGELLDVDEMIATISLPGGAVLSPAPEMVRESRGVYKGSFIAGTYTGDWQIRVTCAGLADIAQNVPPTELEDLINALIDARLGAWRFTDDGMSNRSTGSVQEGVLSIINTARNKGGSFRYQGVSTIEDPERTSIMGSVFGPIGITQVSHADAGYVLEDGTIVPVAVGSGHRIYTHAFKATLNGAGAQSVSGYNYVVTVESPFANGGVGAGARWGLTFAKRGQILPDPNMFWVDPDFGATWYNTPLWDGSGRLVGAAPSPNFIANADFRLWRAGTSFAIGGSTTHLADRWKAARAAAGATYSRQAGFAGAEYCLRMQRDEGDSSTASLVLFQHFTPEQARQLAGKTLYVSLDGRAGANYSGGALIASFYSGTAGGEALTMLGGSAGFPTGNVQGGNINLGTPTTTEARLSSAVGYTVPADARDLAMRVFWTPTGTAGAADRAEVTRIRVAEAGTVPTPYDAAEDEAECDRFWRSVTWYWPAVTAGATAQRAGISFDSPMRATPAVSVSGQVRDVTGAADCTSSAAADASATGCTVSCTGHAGLAVGNLLRATVILDARL